jgi:hypothetical protein
MEIVLAKKILELEPIELSQILSELMFQHPDAFEELKEAVEDAI